MRRERGRPFKYDWAKIAKMKRLVEGVDFKCKPHSFADYIRMRLGYNVTIEIKKTKTKSFTILHLNKN